MGFSVWVHALRPKRGGKYDLDELAFFYLSWMVLTKTFMQKQTELVYELTITERIINTCVREVANVLLFKCNFYPYTN